MSDLELVFLAAATRPLIVCDIDGILAWYPQAATLAVNLHFGTSYGPDWSSYRGPFRPKEQTFLQELREGDYCEAFVSTIAPDTQGIACLQRLAQDFAVIVASDRPRKVRHATQAWLERWGVPYQDLVLQGPGAKERLAAEHGPANPVVFIDDSPFHFIDLPRPGVEVWSPRRSYTPMSDYPGVRVFDDWEQLADALALGPMMAVAELA